MVRPGRDFGLGRNGIRVAEHVRVPVRASWSTDTSIDLVVIDNHTLDLHWLQDLFEVVDTIDTRFAKCAKDMPPTTKAP
jgi:hypothetical protein